MHKPLLGWVSLGVAMAIPVMVVAQEVAPAVSEAEAVAAAPEPSLTPTPVAAETPPPAGTELATVPVDTEEKAEAPAARPAAANRLIEEVVVTAQKRSERLQDVPISIQAFTQDKLDVLGIQSVQDVQRATPGFTVTNSAGFNITFLRGVGSDAFLPGVDSSVPFYLDGVPLLGIQGTSDTLGRIDRVEVLKGPQGTLFGRNATGGAISIITPDPDQVFGGDVKLEFAKYDQRNVVAYVNVPVSESFAFNVSGFSNDRDNFTQNEAGGKAFDVYSRGGRVKARWLATDELALTVSGSYQENSGNGGLDFQLIRPAPALAAVLGPGDPKLDRRLSLDGDFGTRNNAYIISGIVNYNATYFDSKLTYATQKIKSPSVDADFDGTRRTIASAHGAGFGGSKQSVTQDTLELQILSNKETPFSDTFEWVAGLFYLDSIGGFDPIVFNLAPGALNAALPGFGEALTDPLNQALGALNLPPILGSEGIQLANYGLIDSRSYSGYGQGTLHLLETVDFTAGIRYQSETRELKGARTSYLLADRTEVVLPLPPGQTPKLHPKQTSLRGALQWRPFGPDDQIYASWARGFKNPTYNTVNITGNAFGTVEPLKAERVDTAELGIKTQLFDKNLQLNAAAFYTVQKDPLTSNVTIISGGIASFINAGEAEIKGADADFLLIPLPQLDPGLVVTGGFSYLDATFTDFKNGQGYDDATGLGFGEGGPRLPARDLSGNRLPRVPKTSWQAAISQRIELDDGNAIELGADTFYSSTIFFLPQNSEFSKRDPLHLYNARVTYFYTPWGLDVTAFCNNITDKIYVESAFVSDFGTAVIANDNPRLYGLRAKISF